MPSTQGVQAWDRYTYTNNNPLRYTDPTGHYCVEDEFVGSCATVEHKMTHKWETQQKERKEKNELNKLVSASNPSENGCSRTNPSIVCITSSTSEPDLLLQLNSGLQSPSEGYSNEDLDALYVYWENMVEPINELVSLEDVYRMSGRGGWRTARYALNLGIIEAVVQGSRQAYRDSWYQSLTTEQRLLRPVITGFEAFVTDVASGVVGAGYAAAGSIGGPLGAVGGKLAGSTATTKLMDRFWVETVNQNLFNNLGAWP